MSDEKTYTERDLIVAKRGAYIEGALADHNATGWVREMGRVEREAHEKYPLPKVTRQREKKFDAIDGGVCRVKLIDGQVVYTFGRDTDAEWHSVEEQLTKGNGTLARNIEPLVDVIRCLRANPTETVEDDQ